MQQDTPKRKFQFNKGMLSDKRTQYLLIGILLVLFALITVFDRTGIIGHILAYIFIYIFGSTYVGIMAIMAGVGVYFIVKKDKLPWKWNITSIFAIVLVFFALIAFGDNEDALSAVFSNYGTNFKTFVQTPGFAAFANSGTAGGILGHFFYSLLATILTPIVARIIYLLAIVAGLFFVLKPFAYWVGEHIVHRNDAIKARDQRKMEEKERAFNQFFDDREKVFIDQNLPPLQTPATGTEPTVEAEDEQSLINADKTNGRTLRNRPAKDSTSEGSRSAFNAFKDNSAGFNAQTTPVAKAPTPFATSSSTKSFNVFKEEPINDQVTSSVRHSSVPEPSISNNNYQRPRGEGNTQGGVFVAYPQKQVATPTVEKVEEITQDLVEQPAVQVQKEQPVRPEPDLSIFATPPTAQPVEPTVPLTATTPEVEEVPVEEHLEMPMNQATPVAETPAPQGPDLFATLAQEGKPVSQTPVAEAAPTPVVKPIKRQAPYRLPGVDLLEEPVVVNNEVNIQNARVDSAKLNNKFESLGINAHVVDFIVAPAFTQYRVEPGSDVKISQFSSIQNDLKMALSAVTINVQAPLAGTSYVGIEVPNKLRSNVSFKEVFCDIQNVQGKPLLVAIGKDASGQIVSIEINKAPHLLIAGATGTGKSVCMHTIIVSLLMRTNPDEVKMMLIDPKKVELSEYATMPHLICPIIKDVKKAKVALHKLTEEMDRRYTLLSQSGQPKIEDYNDYAVKNNLPKMKYYVVIIDELSDLMSSDLKHEIEASIARLTALARAAGIYLIVATQYPVVTIVTGAIKANIPSRIAFATASQVGSRVIIDDGDACGLLGNGDMILAMSGALGKRRVQGAFVKKEEIHRVVAFASAQREPEYEPEFIDLEPKEVVEQQSLGEDFGSDEDDTYNQIIEFLTTQETVSISGLQRKFALGFARAGRYIDQLEEEGLIGAPRGGKPREVLHDQIVARVQQGDNNGSQNN